MERVQQSRQALGSDVFLTLVTGHHDAGEIMAGLWASIDAFEARFSRFREQSELTAFNHDAGQRVRVSRPFYDLLKTAKQMAEQTTGLFNPFTLPALQQAGYNGSWPAVTTLNKSLDYTNRRIVGAETIHLHDGAVTIPQGSAIDFGGIGKGYLLDLLGDTLTEQGISDYWLSLGGDILCSGNDVTGEPWEIGIQDVHNPESIVAKFSPKTGKFAVATSGTTKRRGPGWHHLIDPRTGKPANTDVLTASVAHPSATKADVLAKCFVIAGSQELSHLMDLHQVNNVLLQTDGSKANMVIRKGDKWSD